MSKGKNRRAALDAAIMMHDYSDPGDVLKAADQFEAWLNTPATVPDDEAVSYRELDAARRSAGEAAREGCDRRVAALVKEYEDKINGLNVRVSELREELATANSPEMTRTIVADALRDTANVFAEANGTVSEIPGRNVVAWLRDRARTLGG